MSGSYHVFQGDLRGEFKMLRYNIDTYENAREFAVAETTRTGRRTVIFQNVATVVPAAFATVVTATEVNTSERFIL